MSRSETDGERAQTMLCVPHGAETHQRGVPDRRAEMHFALRGRRSTDKKAGDRQKCPFFCEGLILSADNGPLEASAG